MALHGAFSAVWDSAQIFLAWVRVMLLAKSVVRALPPFLPASALPASSRSLGHSENTRRAHPSHPSHHPRPATTTALLLALVCICPARHCSLSDWPASAHSCRSPRLPLPYATRSPAQSLGKEQPRYASLHLSDAPHASTDTQAAWPPLVGALPAPPLRHIAP